MSGLAHFLEEQGVATVVVALVREHAEAMGPPRALWVPYPLGRPFGVPNDPATQMRVLRQALELLNAPSGPVLVDAKVPADDFSEKVSGSWACPVSFAREPGAEPELEARVGEEMMALRPWYDLGVERRGRTSVGLAALPPDECVGLLVRYIADRHSVEFPAGVTEVDSLRWSAADVRAFYLEAATAQPGGHPSAELENWFWRETAAGEMIVRLRDVCLEHEDPGVVDVGDYMLVMERFV